MVIRLLYFSYCSWSLVDFASGYLKHNDIVLFGSLSAGAIIRIAVLLLFLRYLMLHNEKAFNLSFGALIFLFAWSIAQVIASGITDFKVVFENFHWNVKLLFPLVSIVVVYIQCQKRQLGYEAIMAIVFCNTLAVGIALLVGVLGVGVGMYNSGSDVFVGGTKGFFYSGNELAIVLVVLYALFLFGRSYSGSSFRTLLVVSAFFLMFLVTFTKTALIGGVIITLSYLVGMVNRGKLFFGLGFGIPMLIAFVLGQDIFLASLSRWEFFAEASPSWVTFVMSGRDQRLFALIDIYSGLSVLEIVLGSGANMFGSFEMDFIDIFLRSGLFGVLVCLVWVMVVILSTARMFLFPRTDYIAAATIGIVVYSASMVAGHVLYSASAALFVALAFAMPLWLKSSYKGEVLRGA